MTANFALQRLPILERFVGSLIKQAKSWQLRARTSVARPWQSQGKRKEAYDLLGGGVQMVQKVTVCPPSIGAGLGGGVVLVV